MTEITGQPMPLFSEDDVVNFCVAEAVTMRVNKHRIKLEKEQQQQQEVKEWQNSPWPDEG